MRSYSGLRVMYESDVIVEAITKYPKAYIKEIDDLQAQSACCAYAGCVI